MRALSKFWGDEVLGVINTVQKHAIWIIGYYLKKMLCFGNVRFQKISIPPSPWKVTGSCEGERGGGG